MLFLYHMLKLYLTIFPNDSLSGQPACDHFPIIVPSLSSIYPGFDLIMVFKVVSSVEQNLRPLS